MRIKPVFYLLLITLFTLPAFAQGKDAILGKWLNASGEGQIMIFKKGDKYAGNLVWLKQPHDENGKLRLDTRNPNPAFNTRPLLGTEILQGLNFTGNGFGKTVLSTIPKQEKLIAAKSA